MAEPPPAGRWRTLRKPGASDAGTSASRGAGGAGGSAVTRAIGLPVTGVGLGMMSSWTRRMTCAAALTSLAEVGGGADCVAAATRSVTRQVRGLARCGSLTRWCSDCRKHRMQKDHRLPQRARKVLHWRRRWRERRCRGESGRYTGRRLRKQREKIGNGFDECLQHGRRCVAPPPLTRARPPRPAPLCSAPSGYARVLRRSQAFGSGHRVEGQNCLKAGDRLDQRAHQPGERWRRFVHDDRAIGNQRCAWVCHKLKQTGGDQWARFWRQRFDLHGDEQLSRRIGARLVVSCRWSVSTCVRARCRSRMANWAVSRSARYSGPAEPSAPRSRAAPRSLAPADRRVRRSRRLPAWPAPVRRTAWPRPW